MIDCNDLFPCLKFGAWSSNRGLRLAPWLVQTLEPKAASRWHRSQPERREWAVQRSDGSRMMEGSMG